MLYFCLCWLRLIVCWPRLCIATVVFACVRLEVSYFYFGTRCIGCVGSCIERTTTTFLALLTLLFFFRLLFVRWVVPRFVRRYHTSVSCLTGDRLVAMDRYRGGMHSTPSFRFNRDLAKIMQRCCCWLLEETRRSRPTACRSSSLACTPHVGVLLCIQLRVAFVGLDR